jgi:DNA-binding winged helix-turn-helix (wHTH) protein
MEDVNHQTAPIRFGLFELDRQAGELRRQGFKVKLQEQPFQVLLMLVERPGEVLTREELQKRLWPTDTFVDFERGLNRAINKLREALKDNADNPLFIQTYRGADIASSRRLRRQTGGKRTRQKTAQWWRCHRPPKSSKAEYRRWL